MLIASRLMIGALLAAALLLGPSLGCGRQKQVESEAAIVAVL
jgi:hypothetical protein